MRVVDTSIWIEWLINSPLNQTIAESFPESTECIVPTIVQLELCKWPEAMELYRRPSNYGFSN
jgi:hypothetical protein